VTAGSVVARLAFVGWVTVIVLAVVPWSSWQDHSHWPRVGWIPFASPPIRARDIVVNTLLYVPFGLFCRRAWGRPLALSWGWIAALAFLLSLATEATQIYSHGRFPSATDVTTNVAGALLGGWIARRWATGR